MMDKADHQLYHRFHPSAFILHLFSRRLSVHIFDQLLVALDNDLPPRF
jgi:hypothetical protein